MKVVIKGTDKVATLSITDANGVNYVKDFIGNYDAFLDGQFTINEDLHAYEATQETFDWWEKVINDNQALEDRLNSLREEYGSDRVNEIVSAASDVDLEDLAAAVNKALDEELNLGK
ncbi:MULTISPECIES: hypothetical protein [unclassified Paenibacillus]|uniref:hypothetical protein n=1 Tax=unclassified Paenibacillus TaxID=185978 RepID=UPI00020D7BB5|nr:MULTISPECIES: hypothetical protein [unclassified Paenibacillus]EGL18561.1 hypothetical protein HMPREF9413_5927 [Paenibacillus sp. HGF7]EPD80509.1 hypothetical protein HMPREF1207_05615 [Paenibacillus sp. HGH0039]